MYYIINYILYCISIKPIKYSKCMKKAVCGDELENFEKTKHENFHASFNSFYSYPLHHSLGSM